MIERTKHCDYCRAVAALRNFGDDGYPYATAYGPVWICVPCQAWCGCHPGTERPLGRLANAELRKAKQAAHTAFDPLWMRKIRRDKCSKNKARKAGYYWLSKQLGIPFEETHIGMFDVAQCEAVVEVCSKYHRKVIQ